MKTRSTNRSDGNRAQELRHLAGVAWMEDNRILAEALEELAVRAMADNPVRMSAPHLGLPQKTKSRVTLYRVLIGANYKNQGGRSERF